MWWQVYNNNKADFAILFIYCENVLRGNNPEYC